MEKRIFGVLSENMGVVVNGGKYQPNQKSRDGNGFREVVKERVKEVGVILGRYLGGNVLSGYNGEDGIGPRDQRTKRTELDWRAIETKQVGIHEFAQWADEIGVDVNMAVEMGTGGIDEARILVEYGNFEGGTDWGGVV
ncbi:hypothetical protein [Streptococcus thoraltensis]